MTRFRKILIANRGEIAVRVIRTCRDLGISTVAVYSEADRASLHVRMADQALCIGPAPSRQSYLKVEQVIAAAKTAGADAIHPGYGFLSENPALARACERAGIVFIGPPPLAMEAMGEKTRARAHMVKAGVPVVPGTTEPLTSLEQVKAVAADIGWPLMLKAANGGGGKGMRRVANASELESAWRSARSEALSSFGNDAVYVEKYLDQPHHVEIQVFADALGHCIHLHERECSAQRRHQKVIEETPSPILTSQLREQMGEVAVRAAQAVGYVGAGTVEFLVDAERKFYFLEMNTRLQVEHPVTEWVTGLDLVAWQIRVAQGEALPETKTPPARGHSVEARIYAEDPAQGFLPSPGKIQQLTSPSGPNVRNDTSVYPGYTVPNVYDPMIGKLSVWAPTRAEAIARLRRALSEYVLTGITTNIPYLLAVLEHPTFQAGNYDTHFLDRAHAELTQEKSTAHSDALVLAAAIHAFERDKRRAEQTRGRQGVRGPMSPWRLGRP